MQPDIDSVKKDIYSILPNIDWDDSCFIGPLLLRLAWHTSGTFDKYSQTGGSNGATMRFQPESIDPENKGLEKAREFLEPIKAKHAWISYADLWTLAGVVAVEAMGGPKIKWYPGRRDAPNPMEKNTLPRQDSSVELTDQETFFPIIENGRLPDANKDQNHIRQVFQRMGMNDQETVALIGAHCVGRCHTYNSGFHGPWTTTPIRFSNSYFLQLRDKEWIQKEWDGPLQYKDKSDKEEFTMMLPTDISLLKDSSYCHYVHLYAERNDLWMRDFANAFAKLLSLNHPLGVVESNV